MPLDKADDVLVLLFLEVKNSNPIDCSVFISSDHSFITYVRKSLASLISMLDFF